MNRQAARLQSILDQERAAAVEWFNESDPVLLTAYRCGLAEDDSAGMFARMNPTLADVTARLAIIAFDEIALAAEAQKEE